MHVPQVLVLLARRKLWGAPPLLCLSSACACGPTSCSIWWGINLATARPKVNHGSISNSLHTYKFVICGSRFENSCYWLIYSTLQLLINPTILHEHHMPSVYIVLLKVCCSAHKLLILLKLGDGHVRILLHEVPHSFVACGSLVLDLTWGRVLVAIVRF